MHRSATPVTILMADDDPDDRQLAREAFDEAKLANDLRFVENGEELLDYLYRRGKYSDPAASPRPGLILLDLLRNPLAPLRNALEIMRLAADNPSAIESARGMMERQLRHMVRLINDLLDASRITRDKLRIDLAPLDLREPLHTAVESARPVLDEAGVRFELRLPDSPLPINGDHVRLAQLFTNLLTAHQRGQVHRAGGQRHPDGHAHRHAGGGAGDGHRVGAAAGGAGQVFDLFAQVDRTLNRSQGGLCIGLALVRRLAEMHGGSVSAHSDGVDKGATFEARLPLGGEPTGSEEVECRVCQEK